MSIRDIFLGKLTHDRGFILRLSCSGGVADLAYDLPAYAS
jgi:hypothetical protein